MFAFLLYVRIVFKVWHFYLMIGISVLCCALLLYAGHFYFMSGISIVWHVCLMFGISILCCRDDDEYDDDDDDDDDEYEPVVDGVEQVVFGPPSLKVTVATAALGTSRFIIINN